MNNGIFRNICRVWLFVICCFFTMPENVRAQADNTPKTGYVERLNNGDLVFEIIEVGSSHSFQVNSANCSSESPDLERIAVSQMNNPTSIDLYDLKTGNLLLTVLWSQDWTRPCAFAWLDNQRLNYTLVIGDPNRSIIDAQSGQISNVSLPFIPDLPNHPPEATSVVLGRQGESEYLYLYCEDGIYTTSDANCVNSRRMAIYNRDQGVITSVIDAPFASMTYSASFNIEIFSSWSPSGKYVLYEASATIGDFVVYDRENTTSTAYDFNQYSNTGMGYQFSPDETVIGTWLRNRGEATQVGFGVINLQSGTISIVSTQLTPRNTNRWSWSPDGQSILVHTSDSKLIQLGLDGTETIVANDALRVLRWYP